MSDESISVAMCTFDGEKYVREQLDSFVRQIKPPDELVICDDASTDNTTAIIKDFAPTAPFEVRVVVHPRNIGRIGNFSHAVSLCSKDVIFLSDQDDVWHPDKIEAMSRALAEAPDATGVFCDTEIVDAELKPLGRSSWQHCRFTPELQHRFRNGEAFALLLRSGIVPGRALAFRASYRPLLLPLSPEWGHDSWIAALLAAQGRLLFVHDKLIDYRQHDTNLLGVMRAPPTQRERWRSKLRHPGQYYRTKLDSVQCTLRQLDDLEARLASQSAPARFAPHIATIAQRRRRLNYRRRMIEVLLFAVGGRVPPSESRGVSCR